MKISLPSKKGIKQIFRLYLNEVKQVLPSKMGNDDDGLNQNTGSAH